MGWMNLSAARGQVIGGTGTYSFAVHGIQLMKRYRTWCRKTVREKQELALITKKKKRKKNCLKNSICVLSGKDRNR